MNKFTMLTISLITAQIAAAASRVQEVSTAAELTQKINGNPLVVVEFSSQTCGHCKSYDKNGNGEFHKFANEMPNVVCVKANAPSVDGITKTYPGYGINGTPSFRFFKNGQMSLSKPAGGLSKETLKSNVAAMK